MKKALILLSIVVLSGCGVNPDKRSSMIISEKKFTNDINQRTLGEYTYKIDVSSSYDDMVLFSDSNWNVGTELVLVPKQNIKQ